MTLQEIYDKVRTHLLTQNAKAKESFCMYRTPKGLTCAVGCLLGDYYSTELEGNSLWSPRLQGALAAAGVLDLNNDETNKLNLLRRLQVIHDSYPVTQWPTLLDKYNPAFNV